MINSSKYLVLLVLVLIVCVFSVSYSYFNANILKDNNYKTIVSTGNLELKISSEKIIADKLVPIYDENYKNEAYIKEFTIDSNSDSLNSCVEIYLEINDISNELRNEDFKFLLESDDENIIGNFDTLSNKLILSNNIFFESNKSKKYKLYLWISYDENKNQTDMLGTYINANIVVKGYDSKDNNACESILNKNDFVLLNNNCYLVEDISQNIKLSYYGPYINNYCEKNILAKSIVEDNEYEYSETKNIVNEWYVTNIINNNLSDFIVDNSYCIYDECYSVSENNGNGYLSYPVFSLYFDKSSEYDIIPIFSISNNHHFNGIGNKSNPLIIK